jgi:hypothetical protein
MAASLTGTAQRADIAAGIIKQRLKSARQPVLEGVMAGAMADLGDQENLVVMAAAVAVRTLTAQMATTSSL